MRSSRPALAVLAVAALISSGVLVAAGSASAVEPGAGAVIFNPDGTPIGSQLVYGASNTPQFVYTDPTSDDDAWGLDAGSEPANAGAATSGIPLGFSVTVDGVSYDQAVVSSNGSVCLLSSTDPTSQASLDECAYTYGTLIGDIGDAEYTDGTDNYAIFSAFGSDLYPPSASTPVDGADADALPDSCTFGAFLYEHLGTFYCSVVSWGLTTYEGKQAFAATWFHDPDISAADETDFNSLQLLLVNDGAGNATVVYNYDEINHIGRALGDDGPGWADGIGDACLAEFNAGNVDAYFPIGASSFTGATFNNTFVDLFGAACAQGENPQTAAALSDGGARPLAANSLNSAVAGRYVFRVVGGAFTTAALPAANAPTLAASGDEGLLLGGVAAVTLLLGSGLLVARRRALA